MIINNENPSSLILQVMPQNLNGTPKIAMQVATVRVYHVNESGAESIDLSTTPLTHVPSSYSWRHVWEPDSLQPDHYFAEYVLVDMDSITAVFVEDIIIMKALTVEEIDAELSEHHGSGNWMVKGKPDIIPG